MLFIHPVIQASAILLAMYTFFMGLQRLRSMHLHQKAQFPWKKHVLVGKIALCTILIGTFLGLGMVRYHWDRNFMTMGHGKMGLVLLPFLLFGIVSGLVLDLKKKQRKVLPLLHGINNTLLLALAFNQARTGLKVFKMFVLSL